MDEIQHPKKIMASYGVGNIVSEILAAVLAVMLFAFYETEIGLSSALTGIALIIFAIWDATNDPIVGYFSDRPFSFTKKRGRRFPWIIGAFIPMLFFFVLMFYPPLGANQWVIFIWLIVTTCVFDTFESFFVVNFFGLFPDKFRNTTERITASAIGTYFMIFGVILGGLLPPLIIVFGEINSYVLMAWITVALSLACFPFLIPGVRDDKKIVEKFVDTYEKTEKEPLTKTLVRTIKQKNFSAFLVMILLYSTFASTFSSSNLYYTRYVLGAQADIAAIFVATMFTGALIGVLGWIYYVRKTNNTRGVMLYSGLFVVIAGMLFSFIPDFNALIILLIIQGIGIGGFLAMMNPIFGDVVDESVVKTQQRNEGLFGGIRFFVTNFSRVLMAIILATVHELTGFIEASDTQPLSAITGIQLHTGFIPAIFMLAGLIIFWKFYDITPEKSQQIKEKMKELDL